MAPPRNRPAAALRPPGGPPPRPFRAGPDAIELGDMVEAFTLPVLNNSGYINCTIEDTEGQLERAWGHGGGLRFGDEQRGRLLPGERFHIHPCLQRSRWQGMADDEDWEAIRPSVELASRILDDPCITPFFAGLRSYKVADLWDPILKGHHPDWDYYQWDFDASVMENAEEKSNVMFALMAYRKRIVLRFGKIKGHGQTTWDKNTSQCVVTCNENYRSILAGDPGFGAQRWSQPWVPGTDEAAARLRTRYLLAVTIVHEFAHCVWKLNPLSANPEPYLRGRPVNELGYELENMIFAGQVESSGQPYHVSAPYGLCTMRFPSQIPSSSGLPRGQPRDWGITWTTEYPIHMDHCKKMFTKKFWDEDVARYGFAACRPERKKGFRCYYPEVKETDPLEQGLSPKSLILHRIRKDTRAKKMKAAIEADDVDASDEEDEDADGFVIPGSHKAALEAARRAAEADEDSDVDMEDAP